jgi:exonuclease SbcC
VGDTRGGLGLLVLDSYTGQRRDPATLSGGETFYVSLALALGLADLVRDEIGGAELSTLFVDEGFGSLDTQTLDEVMDEIDSLRSGGRCVGIVSHLGELRTRIPVRLEVRAGRRGSTVSPS